MNKTGHKKKKNDKCSATNIVTESPANHCDSIEKLADKHLNGLVNGVDPVPAAATGKPAKKSKKNKQLNHHEESSYKDADQSSAETAPKSDVPLADKPSNRSSKKKKTKLEMLDSNDNISHNNKETEDVAAPCDMPSSSLNCEEVCNVEQNIAQVTETLKNVHLGNSASETTSSTEAPAEEAASIRKDKPQINFIQYESELQMPLIMKIIQKDLSEPYSIYTYRYFIHNWPKLCFLAMCGEECVGAIVCKLDLHRKVFKRGYIAMLAVDQNYRNLRIGSTMVEMAIDEMIKGGADEVVLETEVTNKPALQLYEKLGFVRDKRLFRYYLNGVDALRLKLWLR